MAMLNNQRVMLQRIDFTTTTLPPIIMTTKRQTEITGGWKTTFLPGHSRFLGVYVS